MSSAARLAGRGDVRQERDPARGGRQLTLVKTRQAALPARLLLSGEPSWASCAFAPPPRPPREALRGVPGVQRESGVLSAPEEPPRWPGQAGSRRGRCGPPFSLLHRAAGLPRGLQEQAGGAGRGRGRPGHMCSACVRAPARPWRSSALPSLPACRGPAAWSRARHLSPAPPPRRLRSEQNLQPPSRGFCEETSGHVLAGPGIEASAQKFRVNNGDSQHEPPPIARPRGRGVTPLCRSARGFVLWAGRFRSLCPGPISWVHSFLTRVLPGGPARSSSWGTWPYRSP